MFHIRHTLKPSDISGIGLFANQDVAKGSVVYEIVLADDLLLTAEEFNKLSTPQQSTIKHYGYFDKALNLWHLANDDIKFCNHSLNPNVTLVKSRLIALRDIACGDEILHDYGEIEALQEI